tara:strand:+ start:2238 stop:4397 length:2160 start_codon:yes stop_codon:yes gene_type:complete
MAGTKFSMLLDAKVRGKKQFDDLGRSMAGLRDQAKKTNRATAAASIGFGKLTSSAILLVKAYAGLKAVQFVFTKTAELETQTRSLKVLTGELGTAKKIISELQQFASVTPFTSSELIESAKRLKAFGVDTEKLVDTTQRLADVSGATGARLNEVATAYGQIQAKGRLQGEELLQLQERGIALQDELQKMYGMTGQEFSKALEKGQFSAEAVEVALKNLTETGGMYADGAIAQSDTLAGRLSTLQDNIQRLATNVGKILTPLFKWVIESAINVINKINEMANTASVINKVGLKGGEINRLMRQAEQEALEIAKMRRDPDSYHFLKEERMRDLVKQVGFDRGILQPEIATVEGMETVEVPELLNQNQPKTDEGGKSQGRELIEISSQRLKIEKQLLQAQFDGDRALANTLQSELGLLDIAEKKLGPNAELLALYKNEFAYFDRERQIQEQQRQEREQLVQLEEQYERIRESILVKSGVITQKEADYNQHMREGKRLREQLNGLVGKTKITTEQIDALMRDYPKLLEDATEKAFSFQDALKEMHDAATDLNGNLKRLAVETIGKMSDTLADFVATGKANFNDFARSVLQDLSRIFMKFAIFKTLSVIPGMGFLTGSAYGNAFDRNGIVPFARGGVVSSPTMSLMGEAGPEAILPLKRGSDGRLGVAANGAMGGMTINIDVDATGSPKTSGNPGNAKALGDAIGAAVQQELIKQKRPGGLLAA